MRIQRGAVLALSVLAVSAIGVTAWATMDNLKAYKQVYPDKAAKASCKTCHEGAMGKKDNLNAYGLALQKSKQPPANAKKLSAEDITAVPEAQPNP